MRFESRGKSQLCTVRNRYVAEVHWEGLERRRTRTRTNYSPINDGRAQRTFEEFVDLYLYFHAFKGDAPKNDVDYNRTSSPGSSVPKRWKDDKILGTRLTRVNFRLEEPCEHLVITARLYGQHLNPWHNLQKKEFRVALKGVFGITRQEPSPSFYRGKSHGRLRSRQMGAVTELSIVRQRLCMRIARRPK